MQLQDRKFVFIKITTNDLKTANSKWWIWGFDFFSLMKKDLQCAILETVEKCLSKAGFIYSETKQLKFLVSTAVFGQKENFTSSALGSPISQH